MEYDFKIIKLSELGEIITGKTPSTKDLENFGGDTLFLTPSDNMESRYSYETSRTLSSIGLNKVLKNVLPKDSICVSCIGSQLGKVVITTQTTVTNQQINSIIPNQNYDNLFIYYSMLLLGRKLNFLSKTSTAIPIINKNEFSNMEIKVPNLIIQRKIARLLSTFDSIIETNERIIKNLEAQAQAIFKSWFVDFEPFQDGNFVESELGLIPEGWEVNSIGNYIDFDIGGGWGKDHPVDRYINPAYVIRGTDIPRIIYGEFNKDNYRYHTETNLYRRRLEYGDLVFESSGGSTNQDLGRMLYMTNEILEEYDNNVMPASFCKIIRINNSETRWYIYNLLKYSLEKKFLKKYEVQSTGISNFSFKIFKDDYKIIKPNIKDLRKYYEVTGYNIDLASKLSYQNQTLAQTRDTLLPKLMSGEIDVSNIKIDDEDTNHE